MDTVRRLPGLRLKVRKNGRSLKIVPPDGEPFDISCDFDDSTVSEIRRSLRRTLDQMKELLHREDDDPPLTVEDASRALELLHIRGVSTMVEIFGNERQRVSDIFQSTFPSWGTSGSPAVIVTAGALSRFLPLEFLPLFDLSAWPPCHDQDTLDEAVRRFPGFSAIIKREFQDLKVSQDVVLQNHPKLQVKCFVENSLPGASLEVGFFEANPQSIDFDGPWPASKLTDFAKELAGHLQRANESFGGDARTPGDQIQHFVCHCLTDETVTSDSALILSDDNTATIAELRYWLDPLRSTSGPLIFLNACGTSRMDPMAATSFPRFFLRDNHNRGFIGTETNIPDRFAADFAGCFYRGLLSGLTLGRAIYEAKWTMLRTSKNPLGILYTIYADPDIAVSNAVDTSESTLPKTESEVP